MKFSIIVVNYKTKNLTENCINSIFTFFKNDFEVILVDNNSSDGSIEYLERNFKDKIKIIKNNKNKGFGVANNIGVKIAKGECLFFLNSDTIIKNDFLFSVDSLFNKDKKIGIISPELILKNGNRQNYAYGKFPKILNIIFNKIKNREKNKNNIIETDWVSGASLIIRKKIFNSVNGFDKNFFMYFEDIDLCKRVKELGYKIIVNLNFKIIHLGGQSIKIFTKRKKYYYLSQNYFYRKHHGFFKMLIIKTIRLPYKIITLRKIISHLT